MLPQVNDSGSLLAAFIHQESNSAHRKNLAEKCVEANLKRFWALICGIFLAKAAR
jgi:hypothetical protein